MIQKYPVCERSRAGYFCLGHKAVMRSPVVCRCKGQRPQRPAEGSSPLPTMQRIRGGNGKVEGRACPAPTDCCENLRTRGAREGGSPPLTARAEQSPAPTHIPFPLRGFGGAWRRTTSAASQQSWPARAVVCPAGANIACSPVSLRSTVAPRSQPHNSRLKSGGRPTGVKREQ